MRIDLEPLDPELRELLATARGRDAEDPAFDGEACDRLLARVERQLAASSSAPSSTVAGLLSPGPIAAACATVAIAGLIAFSTRGAPQSPLAPPRVVESAGPSALSPSPSIAVAPQDNSEEAAAIATVSVDDLPSPAAPPAPARPATSYAGNQTEVVGSNEPRVDLAGELRSVDAARIAIARQQYAAALRLLAEHEQRYPGGQLAQERERLRIQALVATGDMAQARSRAAAFRKQHPSGLLLPSVERALEGDQSHDR